VIDVVPANHCANRSVAGDQRDPGRRRAGAVVRASSLLRWLQDAAEDTEDDYDAEDSVRAEEVPDGGGVGDGVLEDGGADHEEDGDHYVADDGTVLEKRNGALLLPLVRSYCGCDCGAGFHHSEEDADGDDYHCWRSACYYLGHPPRMLGVAAAAAFCS